MNKTINVGLAIEQRINELGITKSEFGRRIGIPNQNVNRVLSKSSIDLISWLRYVMLLIMISLSCFLHL